MRLAEDKIKAGVLHPERDVRDATVIKVLASMPRELIEDGFAELAADKSFSQKMRDKFRAVIASGDSLGDEWF